MIERRPESAAAAAYDLLVVGGGIYGVALTLESARRGLRPLLIERGDFGSGTSWNSLRIVHGGLRYLQTLDLTRFRESVRERSWFLREFPDLVRPLPCLMPLYSRGLHRPLVLRAALACNDLLSLRRNAGLAPDRRLPRGRILDVRETERLFPQVDPHGLAGAALWHDASMVDSQRLLMEMLRWAATCGAVALNYVECVGPVVARGRIEGVRARDALTGAEAELRAAVVVNCGGPWCAELAGRLDRDVPGLFPLSLAFNVLIDRPPLSTAAVAITASGRGSRTYFLHPWKGRFLAGTYHAPWTRSVTEGRVDEELLRGFLDDLNRSLPGLDVRREDVLRVFRGFLPARRGGEEALAVRPRILRHDERGGPAGLFSVSGVKYTTARDVAERTLGKIAAWQGRSLPPLGAVPRPEAAGWPSWEELSRGGAALGERVRGLARQEAVVRLDDLLLRRTDWGLDPRADPGLGERVARMLGLDDAGAADQA